MQAYGFQQEYCADVAGATSTTAAAAALQAVTPVLTHLSGIYDETEASFLLYWRGVLLQCVQNEERAAVDFEAFLEAKDVADLYPSLVSQSKQRLRSIRRKLSGDGLEERREPPTVTLGLGGGYQLNAAPGFPHHFGYAGLDVSIKLVGPLRLVVFARPAFSPPLRHESGQLVDPTQRVVLVSFGVGPALRWEGRVRPGFDLRLQLAPNNSNFSDAKLLVGALITGGLDIGLGRSPLALRPMAEVGFLGRSFVLRGGMQVVLALGPARAGGASSAKR